MRRLILGGVAAVSGDPIVAARTGTPRSDEARRDDTMRFRGLETGRYPKAGVASVRDHGEMEVRLRLR
jgi:hypothetical protein